MTGKTTANDAQARAVFAGRIDILYALGRHYLSLPFALLCMVATLFAVTRPTAIIFVPFVFQIMVVIAAEQLTTAYKHRDRSRDDAVFWAKRYTFVSAIAGATWGIGAWFWFVPHSFAAEAYLTLAFLGMTATEFIARSAHRPAYLAHAGFSLAPLILLLLREASLYAIMSAVLVVLFAAVLASYSDAMARLLDDTVRLHFDNSRLVEDLKRQKTDAESARDEAQASNQAKSIFIANISHELRTPLNALLGMAQILDRAELEGPHRNHVKVMLEAGYGLKTLLDDVLTLTEDNAAAGDGECDPAQAARAVARLVQPRAWEKQLSLNVAAIAGVPNVQADPRRVRQVLLKLVDNALKFTDQGSVEIRVESESTGPGGRVRITVADTGPGVAPQVAADLFKPFTPGDPSYTRAQQGAGLGLAVAKRIVDSIKGEIGFESEPGSGAQFWFTLPVSSATARPRTVQGDSPAPTGLSILVFAGEAQSQIAAMLAPFGNTIAAASDVVDAIARAGREAFDVIIADAAHTDMIAASPGVKAPILSLVPHGERAPAGAHEIAYWPGPAARIYSALAVLEQRRHGSESAEPQPKTATPASALDAKAIAELERSLGQATLIEILQAYIATVEQICRAIAAASEQENWDEAARLSQDVAGSAGPLGLAAVADAARALALAVRERLDAADLRSRVQTVVSQHEQTCRTLADLYPTLAA